MEVCVRFPVLPSQQTVLPWWGERWHRLAFVLFVVCWAIGVMAHRHDRFVGWTTEFVIAAAVVSALVTLGREQPIQNVTMVACVFAAAACLWNFCVQIPLTRRSVGVWIAVLLLARGSARYLLRSARASQGYGWWVAVVAGLVAAGFTTILYHGSGPGGRPTALVIAISAVLSTIVVLTGSLPLLMNKRPVEPPVSWEPIVVTVLLATSLWFGWV